MKKLHKSLFFYLALAVFLPVNFNAVAQEFAGTETEIERFKLGNDCRPINLLVEGLSSDAIEIGLKEDAIEKLEAGASLIQLYTGFIYEGPSLIKEINSELIKRTSPPKH